MSQAPDLAQQFNAARQRVLNGEQLTLEEQRRLIEAIRGNRFAASESSGASRSKKASAKKTISDDELNSELDDLLGGIGNEGGL